MGCAPLVLDSIAINHQIQMVHATGGQSLRFGTSQERDDCSSTKHFPMKRLRLPLLAIPLPMLGPWHQLLGVRFDWLLRGRLLLETEY